MSTTSTGRQAEQQAAEYLERHKFVIIHHNWRTRWCEIDIVVQKAKVIYFVEVKYRRTSQWGSGVEYITPQKLQQMHFAAQYWVARHGWNGDYRLAGIEVSGADFEITNWLADLTGYF